MTSEVKTLTWINKMNTDRKANSALSNLSVTNQNRKWISGAMLLGTLLQSSAAFAQSLPVSGSSNNGSSLQAVKEVSVSPNQSSAFNQAPTVSRPGVNLDLGSTAASVLLAPRFFNGVPNVLINVGGAEKLLSPGQLVTPGEFIAAKQVLSGTSQSLSLTSLGSASGGTFSFSQTTGTRVSQIVIPESVSALNLTGSTSLARTGAINNYGSIFVAPGSTASNNAVLAGFSINNFGTAQITSDLTGGAFASSASSAPVNLVLQALSGITNYGTISSTGSLTLTTATGSISNLASSNGQAPVISAVNDITMSAGNGNIVNAGLVQSLAGNINMLTPNPMTNLNVSGTLGTFMASAGAINVRDLTYTATANINMLGGDYISKALNIYAGNGALTGNVGELSGELHTYGDYAHFTANTAVLTIGDSCITGDPLYVNTGGSINISGKLDVTSTSQPLTIVAKTDITGDATSQLVNNGGDITLIAGADISNYSGSKQYPPDQADGTVTIDDISKNSTTGGKIDFTASSSFPIIDSSSSSSKAGKVTLVALADTAGTSGGQVLFPTSTVAINASSTAGSGGDVLVLANSKTTTENVIQLGAVLTGSNTQGGSVGIYAQTPAAGAVSVDSSGAILGSIANSGTGPATAKVVLTDVATAGGGGYAAPGFTGPGGDGGSAGSIDIAAGELTAASLLAYGGGGAGGGGDATMVPNDGGDGGNGNNITVTTSTTLNITGDVNSSGGGGGGAGFGFNSEVGGSGGSAGSITLISDGGNLTVGGGIFAAHGGNGGTSTANPGAQGGGGGGSLGGGGGGGAGGTGGSGGGGGGGGYANFTNLVGAPAYYFAPGGGGAGGNNKSNEGGGGGGFFGSGVGGSSTGAPSDFGVTGGANVYTSGVSGLGVGGNGGGTTPGGGGTFYAVAPEVAIQLIPGFFTDGANYNAYGGASGLGGQNDAQSVGAIAGAAGNIHIDGGLVTLTNNPTPDPTEAKLGASVYHITSAIVGNNILVVSRDNGSGGDLSYGAKAAYNYWLGTGDNLSIVSSGKIDVATAAPTVLEVNEISGSGVDVTVLSGMSITGTPGSAVAVDLASASASGGKIPLLTLINTLSDTADGGNVTLIARSGTLANGDIEVTQIVSPGKNGGDVLLMNNGTVGGASVVITPGTLQGGNIEIYGRDPAGALTFATDGSASGTVLKTGALTNTTLTPFEGSSSGFGGVSVPGKNGTDGGDAGNITLQSAGPIVIKNALALGGGGGGGYGSTGVGFNGGSGGNGGNIVIEGSAVSILGVVALGLGFDTTLNSSGGGGGGGGGGGELQSAGLGGLGGKAGSISVSSSSVINYTAVLLAADGGAGGDGSVGLAGVQGGSGGGGGGGFGGAGGGGGGSLLTGAPNGVGGGGGGAIYLVNLDTPSGGGGGGGNKSQPSGGGSGGGATTDYFAVNAFGSKLLQPGVGGDSGGDPELGTAGADGDDTSGGLGGKYSSSPTDSGPGGLNQLFLSTASNGGGGGGRNNLSVTPASDGSGPSTLSTANNTVSLSAQNLFRVVIPIDTAQAGIFSRNTDINLDVVTLDVGLTPIPFIATESFELNSKDGGLFGASIETPDAQVNITAGTNPLTAGLFFPFLTGIDGGPSHLGIDSKVDVFITQTVGEIVLENSNAPTLAIGQAGVPTNSMTIAAGAQVKASSTLSLTAGGGGLKQIDPSSTATLFGPSIFLISGKSIDVTLSDSSLPTVKASATEDVNISSVGPIRLDDMTAGSGGSGNSITVSTFPDANGDGQITVAAGKLLTADNVNLFAQSTGSGSSVISQEDLFFTGTIVSNNVVLSNSGDSTTDGARNIFISIAPTATANLTVDTDENAAVYSTTASDLNFYSNVISNSLFLSTAGNLNVESFVIANQINLFSANNLNVNQAMLGAEINFSATNSITFNANVSAINELNVSSPFIIVNGSSGLNASDLSLETVTLNNMGMVQGGSVSISGTPGQNLAIINSGLITSTGDLTVNSAVDKNISVGGVDGIWQVPTGGLSKIYFNANAADKNSTNLINFNNDQTLIGATIMTARFPGQSIEVTDGTLVQGNELVWLQTTKYVQTGMGTGQILGNPLIVGVAGQAGTILNAGGNVLLPSNLTFVGQDLSIIAQGSIISAGLASINLSGGFGGSLTMIAGFNFTPTPLGQIGPPPDPATYTIGTPSTGGSINLPGVSINLTGTGVPGAAAGGSLLAVAHGGSITLGTVNTNSTNGPAGSVTLIGQNGVSVAAINTAGLTPSLAGAVQISAADSQTTGTTVISGGTLVSGGFSPIPGTFNNNIVISNINAGAVGVTISTGGTGSITSPPGTSITAGTLTMTAGTGGIGTAGANIGSNAAFLSANSIGDVFLSSTAPMLSLGASSGNKFQLTSSAASGLVQIDGALSANDIVLKSTNKGSFELNAPLGALNGGQANSVAINANGSGSISDLYQQPGLPTISSVLLQLTSGTGSIGSAGFAIQTDASTLGASTGNAAFGQGVYINNLNTSPVTLTGLSSGSSNSSILYTGEASALTVSGQVSGNSISIVNQGSINLNNKVTGAGAVDVQAAGGLTTTSTISGKSIALTTSFGSAGSILLGGPLTSTGAVVVNSDGNITTNSTISGTTIDLVNGGSSGSINVGATVKGTGQINIAAMGGLTTSSTISGNGINLSTAAGTSGSISVGGTLNSSGVVLIASDNNISTSGSISGTDIDIQNAGASGSTTLGGTVTGSGLVNVLAKGNLNITSNVSGDLGIDLSTAAGTSGSIVVGGTLSANGPIAIKSDNSIVTSGNINSLFNVTIANTGASGSTTIGGSVYGDGAVKIDSKGVLSINSPVSSAGFVELNAQGNLNVNAAVSGNNVILQTLPGSNGNIALGANVTSSDVTPAPFGITIAADGVGSITQSTGVLSTSSTPLALFSVSGGIGSISNSIAFNSPTVLATTTGNVYLLALSPNTAVDNSSGNSFNLISNGNIVIQGTPGFGLAANFVNISTLNNGNIDINNLIHGFAGPTANALTVNLSLSGTGALTDSFQGTPTILTNSLTVSAVNGDIGTSLEPIKSNAQNLTTNTLGNSNLFNTRTGTTNVLASSGVDYTLTASKVNIVANSTFSGIASFNTSDFTNPVGTILTGGLLNITGLTGSALTVKNGGTLVANLGNIVITSDTDFDLFVGNAGGPTPGAMQVTGAGSPTINLIAPGSGAASSNDIIFTGNQNFFGDTFINASTGLGQVVQVNTGVTIQGFQSVTVASNDLILQGTLIGNPLIFNSPSGAGTIANSQGDVLLASDLIFNGQSLAILASGNVLVTNPSGILIDLSNSLSSVNLGRGGDLSVVAGFNFSPATGGQVGPSGAVYSIANNPSTSGGSITLSNATIKTGTSVDGANSGRVLAAAHGGVLNNGSVSLGSVDTSNTGVGGSAGDVFVIGQGGVTLGQVNTTGDTDGAVVVSAATPEIIGVISDQNGNFAGNGFIQPSPTTFSGNIVLGSINAGSSSISAKTGAAGSISLADNATLTANQVDLTSGSTGGVQIGNNVVVSSGFLTIDAGSLGIVQIEDDAFLDSPVAELKSIGNIGSEDQPVVVTATTLTANSSAGSVYLVDSATTDVNLVNGLLVNNGAADVFSLLAVNPGATLTSGGAQISAPHVIVESLIGSIDVAVNSALANSIDFRAESGNIALSSSNLSVIPDVDGNGGTISLIAATLTYAGSGLSPLTLNANATGNGNGGNITYLIADSASLTIGNAAGNIRINATGGSAGSSSGNGGSATISTGGNLVFDPSQLNIVPLGNNGNGGSLSLRAGKSIPGSTLTINTSSITENGVGIGNGGNVELRAPVISYQNSGTLPLTITANGGSNGNGGSIIFATTNTAALTIGGGSNSLNLSATSGTTGGNGGSVEVITGGAMTVTPTNLAVGPLGALGSGGAMYLFAGSVQANSPLAITGSLSANAKGNAFGGNITLISNSSTPFVILQKTQPTNGVFGVLTAQGTAGNGNITVFNLAGGITLSAQQVVNGKSQNPAMTNVANVNLNAGGGDLILNSSIGRSSTNSVILSASGNITKAANAILTSNFMILGATTGNIGTTSPFKVTSNNLTVNAGGLVNVGNTSKSLTLNASSAGGTNNFTLTNTGAITTTGDIQAGSVKMSSGANGNIAIGGNITALTATGTVNLTASGTGSIFNQFASGTDIITGSSILLKSSTGSIGTIGTSPVALRVNSGAITPTTSGGVNINNSSTAPLTIAGSLSRQQFLLTTQGNLTISKPIASAKQISLTTPAASNGNIAINANLGGGATTSIIVSAGGTGSISTSTKSITLAASQSITLSSGTGNIGTGTATATAITTRTPLISATTGGTGVVNLNNNRAATLAASSSGGSFTLTNSTNLTVGSLNTTNGDINITAKAGLLQTSPGVTITANNGAILFNNASTAGKIFIANNSTVQTKGLSGGDVQIGIGPLPFAQATPANPPTNVTTTTSGGGQIFFGANSITGPGAGTPAQVNAIGKDVIFSTAKAKATAITLGNGATVTADPPVTDAAITTFYAPSSSEGLTATPALRSNVHESSALNNVNGWAPYSPALQTSAPVKSESNNFTQSLNFSTGSTVPLDTAGTANLKEQMKYESNLPVFDNNLSDQPLLNGQISAEVFSDFAPTSAPSAARERWLPAGFEAKSPPKSSTTVLQGSVESSTMPDTVHLKKGNLFLAPTQRTTISTIFGDLVLDEGSVVLLLSHKKGISIFNFDDAHRGAVEFHLQGQRLSLAPGRHLTIGTESAFADINPAASIPHRNLRTTMRAGQFVFQSEFSLPVAFEKVQAIAKLMASKDPRAHRMAQHMLKTAAVLSQMNRSGSTFQQYAKSPVTAFAAR